VPPPWRRYAGVLVDIYFDHLLARDFERLAGYPLQAYTHAVYAQLDVYAPGLPAPLNRFAAHARACDLLAGYREPGVVAEVLDGIGRRLRRPLPLGQALAPLQNAHAGLAADFDALWPDAVVFARDHAQVAV
jgi:acyl carrier protein phosphodiesterase